MIHLTLYVAVAQNGAIGFQGDMPWRLPSDLKRFKTMTMGKPLIMGRKTFESIGRPLPKRRNIVVSRSGFVAVDGVDCVPSFQVALELGRDAAIEMGTDEICVIGGAQIYALALPVAQKIVLTRVMAEPQGDTFFPDISPLEWTLIDTMPCPRAEGDSADTQLEIYRRRSS